MASRIHRILSNLSRDHSLSHADLIRQAKESEANTAQGLVQELEVNMRVQQKQLLAQLQSNPNLPMADYGCSVFSESDEDGLLLYIFAQIGMTNKRLLDIGGGTTLIGSNSANLILNHDFESLVFEGDEANVARLKAEYQKKSILRHYPPQVHCAYVYPDKVNELMNEHGWSGEIDLMSIDIDSVDYWIWEALEEVKPRVVIAEIQCILGAEEKLSVPREFSGPVFEKVDGKSYGVYNSASLAAWEALGRQKGYRMVATSRLGFNAIFVREDLATEQMPAITAAQGLDKPFARWAQKTFGKQTRALDWVEV